MNDGFNWFVAAVAAVGFIVGASVTLLTGRGIKYVVACVGLLGIYAFYRFIYTPVRGVEDDQE